MDDYDSGEVSSDAADEKKESGSRPGSDAPESSKGCSRAKRDNDDDGGHSSRRGKRKRSRSASSSSRSSSSRSERRHRKSSHRDKKRKSSRHDRKEKRSKDSHKKSKRKRHSSSSSSSSYSSTGSSGSYSSSSSRSSSSSSSSSSASSKDRQHEKQSKVVPTKKAVPSAAPPNVAPPAHPLYGSTKPEQIKGTNIPTYLCDHFQCDERDLWRIFRDKLEEVRKCLKGKIAVGYYGKQPIRFKIFDVTSEGANVLPAYMKAPKHLTVQWHYSKKKAINLRFSAWPCVVQDGGGGHRSFFPIELLFVL